MIFKIDVSKAYSLLDWEYLVDVLKHMGFDGKWCNWIRNCLSSSMKSILINRLPSTDFPIKRGLGQGDTLSMYLFIIPMKGYM